MPQTEQALIEQLVNTYPQVSRQHPSSWFVFRNDMMKVDHHWHEVCHASMQYHTAGVYDQLITGVPRDQPLDLAYITFLIDGPFRSFRDRISLEEIKVKDQLKYYLRCTKLDTWPGNVLYNFCIATRAPVEFARFLPAWGQLTAAGINETLAFLLASRLAYNGDFYGDKARDLPEGDPWEWKLNQIECPTGHFWFDPTSAWKPLLMGDPVVKQFATNFKENPRDCRPCNVIWGSSNRAEASYLIGKTVKELSDYFGFTKAGDKSTIEKMVEDFVLVEPPVDVIDEDFDDDDDDDIFEEDIFDDDF